MKHKITPRQLVALLAAYHGERPYDSPDGLYGPGHEKAGKPVWRGRTNMGGAVARMVEDLRDRGFLTEYNRHEDFGDKTPNVLTAKGFEAILERLGELPEVKSFGDRPAYRFEIDPKELGARLGARMQREAEIERLREEARTAERDRRREAAERAERARLAKLRVLFAEEGLADNWPDERLAAFADKIASV